MVEEVSIETLKEGMLRALEWEVRASENMAAFFELDIAGAYEKMADKLNKDSIHELTDDEKKQAVMNLVLEDVDGES